MGSVRLRDCHCQSVYDIAGVQTVSCTSDLMIEHLVTSLQPTVTTTHSSSRVLLQAGRLLTPARPGGPQRRIVEEGPWRDHGDPANGCLGAVLLGNWNIRVQICARLVVVEFSSLFWSLLVKLHSLKRKLSPW